MSKNKKVKIALTTAAAVVLAALIGAYIIHGLTLVNPHSEKVLNSYLAIDKNYPIEILATAEYEDYYAVLYKDPLNPNTEAGNDYCILFEKNKMYIHRYNRKCATLGAGTDIQVGSFKPDDSRGLVFIFSPASDETLCSVFEDDYYSGDTVQKLDEFEVGTTAFIVVKEYELSNEINDITVYDGSHDADAFTEK